MKKILALTVSIALLMWPASAVPQCIVPPNGAVVKTASYSALAADTGKHIVMNWLERLHVDPAEHPAISGLGDLCFLDWIDCGASFAERPELGRLREHDHIIRRFGERILDRYR